MQTGVTTVARTVEIPDPGDLLSLMPDSQSLLFVQHGEGLVGWGTHERIDIDHSEGRFDAAEAAIEACFADLDVQDDMEVPGSGPVAFGAFTFDPLVQGSVIVVPQVIVGRRNGRAWRTTIGTSHPPGPTEVPAATHQDRVRYQGSTMSEIAWLSAVDRAVDELRAGVAHKVVLARDRRVWSRTQFDARRLVRHLAKRFPECQTFSVDGLVGASPEVLVERQGDTVRSLVLAGTAARGPDIAGDEANAARLQTSDKDVREHDFAVKSVRDGVAAWSTAVEVDAAPHVLRLANVMHLATTVRARLSQPRTALALTGFLHPSAAVCGAPTAAAQQMIRRLEGMDRARYSGPVGWMDSRGDGQWAIALRCAELDGDRARLFAGAGIVDGSLPEAELEETRLKLRAMQSAFES